jgi:cytoskeletal protein RodZ
MGSVNKNSWYILGRTRLFVLTTVAFVFAATLITVAVPHIQSARTVAEQSEVKSVQNHANAGYETQSIETRKSIASETTSTPQPTPSSSAAVEPATGLSNDTDAVPSPTKNKPASSHASHRVAESSVLKDVSCKAAGLFSAVTQQKQTDCRQQ